MPNFLKERRVVRELTQEALDIKVGTDKTKISKLERNERKLTLPWPALLGSALNCEPGDILKSPDRVLDRDQTQDEFRNAVGNWMLAVLDKANWRAQKWADEAGVDAIRITLLVDVKNKTIKPTSGKKDRTPSGQTLHRLATVTPLPFVMGPSEMVDQERAERLRESRKKAGFSKASDAIAGFGWAGPTYHAHENGSRRITVDTGRRYAQVFGVDFNWLYFNEKGSQDRTGDIKVAAAVPGRWIEEHPDNKPDPDTALDRKQCGGRLRTARPALGYDIAVFAGLTGVSEAALNAWESGKKEIPLDYVARRKKPFGITFEWICHGETGGLPSPFASG